jgi:hypothetical protein
MSSHDAMKERRPRSFRDDPDNAVVPMTGLWKFGLI